MPCTARSNSKSTIQHKNYSDSEEVDNPDSIDSTNDDTEKDPEDEVILLSDAPEDVGEFLFELDITAGEAMSRTQVMKIIHYLILYQFENLVNIDVFVINLSDFYSH